VVVVVGAFLIALAGPSDHRATAVRLARCATS